MLQENSNYMRDFGIIAGFLFGFVALGWRIFDVAKSYLTSEIEASVFNLGVNIKVTVENKGFRSKAIKKVFILISTSNNISSKTIESLVNTKGFELSISSINDLNQIEVDHFEEGCFDSVGNGTVSLPFFYKENVSIADEKLTYSIFIQKNNFPSEGVPYFVRLFVFPKNGWFSSRLHRTNQTLFVIEND
jgi:hypothetical protein